MFWGACSSVMALIVNHGQDVRFVQDGIGRARYAMSMSEIDLRTVPNVGPAIAHMLLRLGIERPADLRDQDPERLFQRLCEIDGRRHDPCLLDTIVAAVDYANGAPARPWWMYSRERKAGAGSQAAPASGPDQRPD